MKLSVEHATVGYGAVPVVRALNLEIETGEAVCLVGPNGAGKSTSLRGIMGLNPPSEGSLRWGDEDVTHQRPHTRARMGIAMVPEGRRIFPQLTVLENLDVAARVMGRRGVERRIDLALDHFPKLADRRSQLGGLMSGGEQQMLAIGRALVQEPRLLLIDELSLGLAPVIYEQLGETVRKLVSDGLGVLLVEQNAMLAMSICDRGYLMSGGEVVLSGSVEEMNRSTAMKDLYLGGLEREAM